MRRCLEVERGRVDAIPQAGRLRTIFKDVTEMSLAFAAKNLGTLREQAGINFGFYGFFFDGLIEAGPAGSRIKLGAGVK